MADMLQIDPDPISLVLCYTDSATYVFLMQCSKCLKLAMPT